MNILESALDLSDMDSSALKVDIRKFLGKGHSTRQEVEKKCSLTLLKILEEGLHSDITIKGNGGSVKAHSSVLASISPLYNAMFKHQMREKLSSTVEIPEMSIEGCKLFLVLVYILPDREAAMDVFTDSIVDYFPELFEFCCRYQAKREEPTLKKFLIKVLNYDNCWEYLRKCEAVTSFCGILDYETSNTGPYAICWNYIVSHFNKVIESMSFTLVMRIDPEDVLVCLRQFTRRKALLLKPFLKRKYDAYTNSESGESESE